MGSPAVSFNTLAYASELKKGGFTDEQIQAQTKAQIEAFQSLMDNQLATKHDINKLELIISQSKLATKEELIEFKIETEKSFTAVRIEMQEGFARVDKEMKEGFARVDKEIAELKESILLINHRLDKLFLKMTVTMGSITTVIATITVAVLSFLMK